MNQDQNDLEKARELMFPIIGAIGKEVYLESEYPDNWKRAFGYIANALREERERTIAQCAEIANTEEVPDGAIQMFLKSPTASIIGSVVATKKNIVKRILELKTPPPS